jgi:hypothetical protein
MKVRVLSNNAVMAQTRCYMLYRWVGILMSVDISREWKQNDNHSHSRLTLVYTNITWAYPILPSHKSHILSLNPITSLRQISHLSHKYHSLHCIIWYSTLYNLYSIIVWAILIKSLILLDYFHSGELNTITKTFG